MTHYPPEGKPYVWIDDQRTGDITLSGCINTHSGCIRNSQGDLVISAKDGDGVVTIDCSRLVITGEFEQELGGGYSGNLDLEGYLTVDGNVTFNSDLLVNGDVHFISNIELDGDIYGSSIDDTVTLISFSHTKIPSVYAAKMYIDNKFDNFTWQESVVSRYDPLLLGLPEISTNLRNYLLNGGFETWTNGGTILSNWTVVETGTSVISQETQQVAKGIYSLKMEVDGSGSNIGVNQTVLEVYANNEYELSCYVKSSSSSTKLNLTIQDNNGYYWDGTEWSMTPSINVIDLTNGYSTYNNQFTTKPGTNQLTIRFTNGDNSSSEDIWIDYVNLIKTIPFPFGTRFLATGELPWKDKIYEITSAYEWKEISPHSGSSVYVENESKLYHYNGLEWISVNHEYLDGLFGGDILGRYHLTSTEHGYLSGQDQSLLTTSNVLFNNLGVTGQVSAGNLKSLGIITAGTGLIVITDSTGYLKVSSLDQADAQDNYMLVWDDANHSWKSTGWISGEVF